MKQDALSFRLNPEDVSDDLILKRCKNLRHAVKLCRDCSPLGDDEIVFRLDADHGVKIQRSHLVEALNGGQRNFPLEGIQALEDLCGNTIPTRYLALSRNCELRPRKEALELENDRLRQALAEKDKEIEILAKYKAKGII